MESIPVNVFPDSVADLANDLFRAKVSAMMAGKFTGTEVVELDRCVVDVVCKGKTGWDRFSCVVDNMHKIYDVADREGVNKALGEMGCLAKS